MSFLQIFALHLCWIINSASCLCGYPGRPAYGKLLSSSYLTSESSYNYGDTVNYACEKGYFLRGRGSRTCLNNTKWSGNLPICDSPLQIYGEASSPESIKLYPPSLAIDNNPRSCFYTRRSKPREWTLDLMVVRKVKSVIITVPFASSEHHFTIFMSTLSSNNSIASSNRTRCSSFHGMFATQTQLIVCTEGVEGRYLTIQDDSSAYEYFGLCEVKVTTERDKYECGEPEKPLNSLPIETHKNNVVQYQCKDGYLLEGPAERHCQNDGFWSKGQAVCKEVTCKELEAPLNSRMVLSGLNENRQATILSQAYFHCDSGFQVVGENRLVCLSTGKWSSSTPQCIAIDCGLPKNIVPELSRFILLNGTTRFGSMALLECLNDQGLPETEVTIVCQQDGLWSQAYISCNKQDWLSSETFVKSQLDLVKSGNGNVITSMIIIILCALSMIIILLIALLLKRKFLSVKLVTWRDHDHSDGKRCKALRSKHKRLGATLCTVRKHLGLQSDLPLFGSLKCSFPSLPMATSSEANVVTQSGLNVNSSSQGYGNYNVTDDAGKLINVNKYLDKHDSSKHDCSDEPICVPIEDSYRSSYRNYQNLDEIETNETSIQTGLPSSTPTTTRVTSTVEVTASTAACLDEHALVSTEAASQDWMNISRKKSGYWKREKDRFKRQNIASLSSPLPSSSSSSGFPFSPTKSSSFPSSSTSLLPTYVDLDLTCKRSGYILPASENTELDSSNNLVSQRIVQVDIELPLDVITGLVTSPSSSSSETTTTDSPSSSSSITSKPCASPNDKNNETENENGKVVDVYQKQSSNPTTSACDLSKLPADKISTEKGITRMMMMMMISDPIDNDITLDNGNEHPFDEKQTNLYKHENNCDNKEKEVKQQLDQTTVQSDQKMRDDGRSFQSNGIIKVNTNNSHGKQNSANCSSNSQPYCDTFRSNSSPSTNDKLLLSHHDNHASSTCDTNMDISIITQKSYHSFSNA